MIERIFPDAAVLSENDLDAELLAVPAGAGSTPWVSFNFVSSLDGAATVDGLSGQLGNSVDQRIFTQLRHNAHVILVGAQTVRAEGYGGELLSPQAQQWRTMNGLPAHPPLAIVSGTLNLDPALEVFTNAPVRPLILTLESAPDGPRQALAQVADIITVGKDSLDVELLIAELGAHGLHRIHSEGGPTLLGTFAAADKVDELRLTVSPLLVGGPAGRIAHGIGGHLPRSMTLDSILKADSMLFLRYIRSASSTAEPPTTSP
ncbi:pyrimidine reductase family protein [Arthrobacter glacialis]|uniref:Pyrimidine reductase family protein n=1 Tax=Arthrobacter glacialis TaxID=1664 RepID=A0A2S3ZZW1_ARTGL|nr:pyrimidine reductase family protein [Arthrobacter glacialis]POH58409.1 pyrimidine reductase family protein [Arthrobacter glacialis]POH74654.1 pyrimidine reductase family protein [Arthrobacter glacialis]